MEDYLGDTYALLTAVSWSIAVILFRVSGLHLDFFPLRNFQNIVSIIFLFGTVIVLGEPLWPSLSLDHWTLLIVSAVLGITLADSYYIAALNRLGAGLQGLMEVLYTPFVIVLAFVFYDEVLSLIESVGVLLIVCAIFLALPRVESTKRKELMTGLIYGIGAPFLTAVCILLVKPVLRQESLLTLTAYRFLIGHIVLLAWLVISKETKNLFDGFKPNPSLKWALPGTFFGLYLAPVLWFAGFKYTLAGRAAVYNQTSTLLILVLAGLFLKEPLDLRRWIAVAVSILGGLLVSGFITG